MTSQRERVRACVHMGGNADGTQVLILVGIPNFSQKEASSKPGIRTYVYIFLVPGDRLIRFHFLCCLLNVAKIRIQINWTIIKNIYFIFYSPKRHGCCVIYDLESVHCSKSDKIQLYPRSIFSANFGLNTM